MTLVVALFGAALLGLGIFGLVRPRGLVAFFRSVWQSRPGLYSAIGMRVVFGLLLLATASESRFPQVFRVIGVISLVAAAIAPFLGFARLRRFVQWSCERPPGMICAWSLVTLGFGAFLIYAVG